MPAEVCFQIHDERGAEILAELERRTGHGPGPVSPGRRCYDLNSVDAGTDGFDIVLDKINEQWRDHLTRTP
jgi:hypothetical protein